MKKLLFSLAVLTMAATAFAQPKPEKAENDSTKGLVFTDIKLINPESIVKNQNKSGTCWSFSTCSFLEDEIYRKTGKTVHLSEMFVVNHCYRDKAELYVRMYGNANFGAGGAAHDVPYVWANYGIVPDEAYPGLNYGETGHDHSELDSALKAYTDAIVKKRGRKSTAWKQGLNGIVDAYLGELPETFNYEGKTYTPQSFAEAMGLDMNDYVEFTSFTHHPYYSSFVLEVPDNWLYEKMINVQLQELLEIVDNALENGYSVAWGADVSEPGFKWREGYAVIPAEVDTESLEGTELSRWVKLSAKEKEDKRFKIDGPVKEIEVTPESRQEMFDRQETTDDHGMVIMGIAEDQEGNRYYKVKNSWDVNQVYDGYFYISPTYFLAKTMDIMVNREAVPAHIAKKLNWK